MSGAPNLVVGLYDLTGKMVLPWVEAGRIALIVDLQHPPGLTTQDGRIWRLGADLRPGFELPAGLPPFDRVEHVACFPPCDDMAVSGARWFKGKGLRALSLGIDLFATAADFAERMYEKHGASYILENPTSTISTYWREPDYHFHPFQYTLLAPDDNYLKNTCLWASSNYVMPPPQIDLMVEHAVGIVVSKYGRLLSKKKVLDRMHRHPALDFLREFYPDDRIHDAPPGQDRANFRSATPLGFSIANFLSNAAPVREEENLFA